MQEEYQAKLEQEIQRYNSEQSQREKIDSTARKAEDKLISQQKALETAKRMLHQGRGETESPEMDLDCYGVQNQTTGQPQQCKRSTDTRKGNGKKKRTPKKSCFYTSRGGVLFPKLRYFRTLSGGETIFMQKLSEEA